MKVRLKLGQDGRIAHVVKVRKKLHIATIYCKEGSDLSKLDMLILKNMIKGTDWSIIE